MQFIVTQSSRNWLKKKVPNYNLFGFTTPLVSKLEFYSITINIFSFGPLCYVLPPKFHIKKLHAKYVLSHYLKKTTFVFLELCICSSLSSPYSFFLFLQYKFFANSFYSFLNILTSCLVSYSHGD